MPLATKTNKIGHIISRTQSVLARSRATTHAARKIARLLDGVVFRRLGHDVSAATNGEFLLIECLAHRITHFIDVGANVGVWSSHVVKCAPLAQGILIEPGRDAAQACRTRFASNAAVKVVECAAGERSGHASLAEDTLDSEKSSIVRTAPGSVLREVPMDTLASIVEKAGWNRIDIVKCDAEGYDFQIIKGAESLLSNEAIGVFQFEYNDHWIESGTSLSEALDLFGRYGYETFLVARGGLWKYRYEDYGEFFHHSNFVAVSSSYNGVIQPCIRGTA